jgi:hypothetical protein
MFVHFAFEALARSWVTRLPVVVGTGLQLPPGPGIPPSETEPSSPPEGPLSGPPLPDEVLPPEELAPPEEPELDVEPVPEEDVDPVPDEELPFEPELPPDR